MIKTLEELAKEIAEETGFILGGLIYTGVCQDRRIARNAIFAGFYEGKPAVLKIYDSDRFDLGPIDQEIYNEVNQSKILRAPKVFRYKVISPQKGWLIMEKLPEGSAHFNQPTDDKKLFAELYLEYRKNFPKEPTRHLSLAENMSAAEFAVWRINRWFEMATVVEAQTVLSGGQELLVPAEFIPRYEKALLLIREELKRRKMTWSHGHLKPHELFKDPESPDKYFLTDFAHTHMYPEGYELAFIIWADWLMCGDWKMEYSEWKREVLEWIEVLRPVAEALGIERYDSLMRASLAERIVGAILADVTASNKPREEKEKRLALLNSLLDEVLEGLPKSE